MSIKVEFLTGAALGFAEPTKCHSGSCIAAAKSQAPGRDGWSRVAIFHHEFANNNGWWCPDCVADFKDVAARRGVDYRSRDVPLTAPGEA